jgi:hypothetical protein
MGCTPRGDTRELKGMLVVEDFGKKAIGARLVTAAGERWILTYRAEGPILQAAGKQVVLRGAACDKQGQSLAGQHFDATSLTLVTTN